MMGHPIRTVPFRRALINGILAAVILILPGCDYLGFYTRQTKWHAFFENKPRMSVLNRFMPEDSLLLDGQIIRLQRRREPLLLVAVSSQYKPNEIVALTTLREPSDDYTLFLPKGDYGLFVFADLNQNGYFERNELIGQASVIVDPGRSKDGAVVEGPPITADFEQPGKTVFRVRVKVRATSYLYASLDDEFFDPQFGSMGLYNPAGLMAHTQGFVFGLEDYDEKKTTVLFVHGISGTPRDWKFFVDGLDRSRFQPFFLYYPSGMPLDKLGSLLAQVIDSIDKSAKSGRHKIVLVAHSMGGLVALSAINKLSAEGRGLPSSLKMYVSFSTPYGGDDNARKWIDTAPVVVPVWRDIAAGSEFLQKQTRQRFPKTLPFYLFFTYNDPSTFKLGESSDGIVTLRTQLVPSMQTAAIKVFGFNETHSGLLTDEAGRDTFFKLLDTIAPPRSAGEKAR
jgi:pimeloyl-ACP methyl ester carboxylesterase